MIKCHAMLLIESALTESRLPMLVRCITLLSVALLASGLAKAEEPLSYNKDIRPILAGHCFNCHGPDRASRKGDLRLDQKAAAESMNAIVPGKPDESEIIKRILSTDPDEVMPPPETKKPLTEAQIATLRRWV